MCEQERERLPWENNEETRTEAIAALEPVCMATRKRLSSQSSGGWERCWSSQLVKANQLSFLSLSALVSVPTKWYFWTWLHFWRFTCRLCTRYFLPSVLVGTLPSSSTLWALSLSLLLTGRRREIPQRPGGWYISFARPKDFSDHLYISYPFIFTVKWDNTQSAYTVFCLMNRYISLSPKKHSNSPPSEFAGPET